MDVTETHVSNVDQEEFQATCSACNTTVISFVGKPHMYRFILVEDNDTKPLPFNRDVVCTACMLDLIRFKVEVLAKKNR